MGELEGHEPATDEQHTPGQVFELEEVGAVDHVPVAGKVQRPGTSAGGDQEVARFVGHVVDDEPVLALEPGRAVQGVHTVGSEPGFHVLRDRVGEATLVFHQIGPVDRHAIRVDALAGHEPGAVDDLGASAQDLLRVTAPQRTRAAVGQLVDDRDLPPLRRALVRRRDAGHAGTDDDQVVGVGHRTVPSRSSDRSSASPWR
ncbi:MAG: hypothetical protein U5K30_15055 [Acidimicrobiales bacterium]|nr:hypothetical protein [Acidimicrobiales bacterium]